MIVIVQATMGALNIILTILWASCRYIYYSGLSEQTRILLKSLNYYIYNSPAGRCKKKTTFKS